MRAADKTGELSVPVPKAVRRTRTPEVEETAKEETSKKVRNTAKTTTRKVSAQIADKENDESTGEPEAKPVTKRRVMTKAAKVDAAEAHAETATRVTRSRARK